MGRALTAASTTGEEEEEEEEEEGASAAKNRRREEEGVGIDRRRASRGRRGRDIVVGKKLDKRVKVVGREGEEGDIKLVLSSFQLLTVNDSSSPPPSRTFFSTSDLFYLVIHLSSASHSPRSSQFKSQSFAP